METRSCKRKGRESPSTYVNGGDECSICLDTIKRSGRWFFQLSCPSAHFGITASDSYEKASMYANRARVVPTHCAHPTRCVVVKGACFASAASLLSCASPVPCVLLSFHPVLAYTVTGRSDAFESEFIRVVREEKDTNDAAMVVVLPVVGSSWPSSCSLPPAVPKCTARGSACELEHDSKLHIHPRCTPSPPDRLLATFIFRPRGHFFYLPALPTRHAHKYAGLVLWQ